MDYFKILNLYKEPFSNSPDPEYFFQSRQHLGCLQKLELSLRLKRGLNVVIGDVGTGKTTLCRQLIRKFGKDEEVETYLILDPNFSSPSEFLLTVVEMFEGKKPDRTANDWQNKEIIKKHLFCRGVDEKKTIVLIIDEGQKIPIFCLEILREFLNYETNEYKLLQIAIFAQKEFEKTLSEHANFADRINTRYLLGPMNFRDTRSMIQFRLKQSSEAPKRHSYFTYPALSAIYRETGGYPRKIINLCHKCILTMIIQNRSKIGWFQVRSCISRTESEQLKKRWQVAAAAIACFVLVTIAAGLSYERFKKPVLRKTGELKTTSFQGRIIHLNGETNQGDVNAMMVKKETNIEHSQPFMDKALPESEPESELSASTERKQKDVSNEQIKSSSKHSENVSRLPEILGKVALKQNETLWRLTQKVYGVADYKHLNSLKQVNPKIKNPDHVEVGQLITVPAIPADVKALLTKYYWIEIEKKDSLESAIDVLRNHPDNAPSIRLVPYWNNREGLKFAVLLKDYFVDETFARNKLFNLPAMPAAKGKILSSWDEDTVFFADPKMGRRQ